MQVLVLQSSPRKNGNTATLVERFLAGMVAEGTHDVRARDVREFWLNDLDIRPCQGCFRCAGESSCIIDDDMQQIYPEIVAADLVVFATPIYWWHMNAQMKLCIDRMTALLEEGDTLPALTGKHVVLVVTYNFEDCARATKGMFKDFVDWINVKLDVIEYCSREGHVSGCESKLKEAFDLGQKLAQEWARVDSAAA
jgi:multimeric flavodoxin WrbA